MLKGTKSFSWGRGAYLVLDIAALYLILLKWWLYLRYLVYNVFGSVGKIISDVQIISLC